MVVAPQEKASLIIEEGGNSEQATNVETSVEQMNIGKWKRPVLFLIGSGFVLSLVSIMKIFLPAPQNTQVGGNVLDSSMELDAAPIEVAVIGTPVINGYSVHGAGHSADRVQILVDDMGKQFGSGYKFHTVKRFAFDEFAPLIFKADALVVVFPEFNTHSFEYSGLGEVADWTRLAKFMRIQHVGALVEDDGKRHDGSVVAGGPAKTISDFNQIVHEQIQTVAGKFHPERMLPWYKSFKIITGEPHDDAMAALADLFKSSKANPRKSVPVTKTEKGNTFEASILHDEELLPRKKYQFSLSTGAYVAGYIINQKTSRKVSLHNGIANMTLVTVRFEEDVSVSYLKPPRAALTGEGFIVSSSKNKHSFMTGRIMANGKKDSEPLPDTRIYTALGETCHKDDVGTIPQGSSAADILEQYHKMGVWPDVTLSAHCGNVWVYDADGWVELEDFGPESLWDAYKDLVAPVLVLNYGKPTKKPPEYKASAH